MAPFVRGPGPWPAQAAVAAHPNSALAIEPVWIDSLQPHEILVQIAGTGICQTDLHLMRREYPVPFPLIPGHEGAGWIVARGASVTRFEVGDPVVLTYPSCGSCAACARGEAPYCDSGFDLSFGGAREDGSTAWSQSGREIHGHFFQQSSFATLCIATERNAVLVPESARGLPLAMLGPLGCSLQTGAGTIFHSLGVASGESVAVIGVGSVGMAAIMAAAAVGAGPVVAVDVQPERLALALELGATHAVDARADDLLAALREIVPQGFDHVVEVSGRPEQLGRALAATRLAGQVAFVAGTPTGTTAAIDMNVLLNGRRLRGVIQGDADPATFIPALLELHMSGRFPFDRLITAYEFADIQQAAEDLRAGAVVKPVVYMPREPESTT